MLVRLNMYAILKKPLNLANKINLKQKQYVSAGLLNLTFGYLKKTKINVGKSVHFVAVL